MAKVTKREWTSPKGEEKSAWMVRYVQNGKHRSRQFDKKKDADQFRIRIEGLKIDGKNPDGFHNQKTMRSLCDDYLKSVEDRHTAGDMSRETVTREKMYIDYHIIPFFGDKRVTAVTVNDIDGFMKLKRHTKSERGISGFCSVRRLPKLKKTLQPSYVKTLAECISRILSHGVKRELLNRNVAREVIRWSEYKGMRADEIRTFTLLEAKSLIAVIVSEGNIGVFGPRNSALLRAVTLLGLLGGLRIGEVWALSWDCIDFENRCVIVNKTLDRWDKLKSTKTKAGVRIVPMPIPMFNALNAWRRFCIPSNRDLLFRVGDDRLVSSSYFHTQLWQKLLDFVELGPDENGRRLVFHATRHFYASMLVGGGLALTDVSSMMGHSRVTTTLSVYSHPMASIAHRGVAVDRVATDLLPLQ